MVLLCKMGLYKTKTGLIQPAHRAVGEKRCIMYCMNMFLLLVLAATTVSGQAPTLKRQAGDQAVSLTADTIYFPFYHGSQMIEIDYAAAWMRDVSYHESMQPRALRWSDLIPKPQPNIYLLRDSTGHVFRAFNTSTPLSEFEKHLNTVRSSTSTRITHLAHSFTGSRYAFDLNQWKFHGYYLVHTVRPNHEGSIHSHTGKKSGIIDSMGNLVFPIIYDFIDEAGENFLVKKDNLFGIISKESNIILPFVYDEVNLQNEGVILFSAKKKIHCVYENAYNKITQIDHFDWVDDLGMDDLRRSKKDGLVRYGKNGKIGFINKQFIPVVAPIYDYVRVGFYDDLMRVNRNRKWGYINRKGIEVIPCRFDDAIDFNEGKAAVVLQGEKKCINTLGAITEECRFDYQGWKTAESRGNTSYIKNRQIVQREQMEGLLDEQGRFILPIIYNDITGLEGFHPEISRWDQRVYKVRIDKKLGLIDKDGIEILPIEYDQIQGFNGESRILLLEKNGRYGLLDSNLNWLAACKYESLDPYMWSGKIWYREGELWGVMNLDQSTFIKPRYQYHGWMKDGRSTVGIGNIKGMIDSTGREIIPVKYDQLGDYFTSGLLMAMMNGKWGFINSLNQVVIPFEYEEVRRFTNTITGVKKGKYYYFIDRNNQRSSDMNYDFIDHEWYPDKKVKVIRNKKIGWVDESGKEAIPCLYDEVRGYNQQGHYVRMGNQWLYVK